MRDPETRGARLLSGFALFASVAALLWFPVAALGVQYGYWSLGMGLGTLTLKGGPIVVGVAVLLALIALVSVILKRAGSGAVFASVLALALAGTTAYGLLSSRKATDDMPPIHDVQTDWTAPIMPSAKLTQRRSDAAARNAVDVAPVIPDSANARWPGFGGMLVAEAQENAEQSLEDGAANTDKPYPPLETLRVSTSLSAAQRAIRVAFTENNWEIVTDDPKAGQFEATATTRWYGFEDDVLVRLAEADAQGFIEIDIRSVSRIGLTDLGVNAKRVAMLREQLASALTN